MTFVTNDCLAYFIYKRLDEQYTSPFIASFIESDHQFLELCLHYDKYINLEPVLGKPKLPVTKMDYDSVPVMFLGDIEIHWPHERSDADIIEKFKRRRERAGKPTFIWSDMQMFNHHTARERKRLIKRFKGIEGAIFVEKDDIEEHRDKSIEDRTSTNFSNVPTWLDYPLMANHIVSRL